jgi:ATP-binding cassette subfamily F protein uup
VGNGNDTVTVNGRPRHVNAYLRDFLFPSERAASPVKALSGGERNRLLLARLFTRPVNLLVLDEPTNDLDLETLELLEAQLVEWSGTLLLVSHDRAFLDNVVTSTFVFEGAGRVREYVGGYEDWVRQRKGGSRRATVGGAVSQAGGRRPSLRRPIAAAIGGCERREEVVIPRTTRAGGAARRDRGAGIRTACPRPYDSGSGVLQGAGRQD